jgi:membrane-associated phospholipid phosphatase
MLYRERRWRWPFAVAAVLLMVITYSRVYLGVHWPTDVLGGLLIGAVWLLATQYAFARDVRQRQARPRVEAPFPDRSAEPETFH